MNRTQIVAVPNWPALRPATRGEARIIESQVFVCFVAMIPTNGVWLARLGYWSARDRFDLHRLLPDQGAREVALPSPHTTTATKRFKKVEHATALLWKILQIAESMFRRLEGAELLLAVYAGVQYANGVQRITRPQQQIAA